MSLTPEQKALRAGRIGSSDIGAILGVADRTAMDVFNEKVLPVGDEPSPEMEWGSALEEKILHYHADREGKLLIGAPTLVHPVHDFACATPDSYLGDDGCYVGCPARVVEAKNVGFYRASEWGEEGDDAPFKFLAQVHWQIGVAKAAERNVAIVDVADLVPSIGGTPPRKYVVKFDPELFGIMLDRAAKFVRDHLQTGNPPRLDGSPAADEYLRRRYGVHDEKLLPYDPDVDGMREKIIAFEEVGKQIDKDIAALRQAICARIGDAAGIEKVATWKKCRDTIGRVTDWKLLAELLAGKAGVKGDAWLALVAEQTIEKVTRQGSRRLILSRPKAKNAAKAA